MLPSLPAKTIILFSSKTRTRLTSARTPQIRTTPVALISESSRATEAKARNVAHRSRPYSPRPMQTLLQRVKSNTCQSTTTTKRSSACTINKGVFQMVVVIKVIMLVDKLSVFAHLKRILQVNSKSIQGRTSQVIWLIDQM